MKIATFNVNSIKARLPRVLEWLIDAAPDVACLQEIKSIDENFPAMEIEALGYNVAVHGQKTYNGVALLSKYPLEDIVRGLPGEDFPDDNKKPDQARYIEAFTGGIRVASIYLPNGNPTPGEKYDYKLRWMERLNAYAKTLLQFEEKLVMAGDYNVCPKDEDCHDPTAFAGDALMLPQTRQRFRTFLNLGFTDALRQKKPSGIDYTFWDYQRGAWQKDNGLRIDHFLLSPQALDALVDCQIDRKPRGLEKASDHTPIWCEIAV
jgi:exodeoxyribonuclease III